MPIHDWTRVAAGTYHDFHQGWTIGIRNALNRGILPPGYIAMADQRVAGPEPDVVALKSRGPSPSPRGGLAVADVPPRARQSARIETEKATYARKANRLSVRDKLGRVVAIIEVVSPGNKSGSYPFQTFVAKAVEFLRAGVSLLIVDPFPPTPRDPDGVHHAIWNELVGEPFEPRPEDKPLTVAAYDAGDWNAYVDPVAVGDALPDGPLFLAAGWYVNVPLEATYAASWAETPQPIRDLVETPEEV